MLSFTDRFMSVDVAILTDHDDDRPPFYHFSSPHLNGLTGAEARMRAQELLTLFNGTMRAYFGANFYDFSLGDGRDLLTRGPIVNDYRDVVPVPLFPEDVDSLRYLDSHLSLDQTGKELFLARTNDHLRYIFRTLGREGLTFVSLYKVLDTMEAYVEANGSKNAKADLAALGGKTVTDIGDFTWTANFFDVAGYGARHGMRNNFKPAKKNKAVSLEQAIEIMVPIVRAFVQQRVDQDFDHEWKAVLIERADQADPPQPLEAARSVRR